MTDATFTAARPSTLDDRYTRHWMRDGRGTVVSFVVYDDPSLGVDVDVSWTETQNGRVLGTVDRTTHWGISREQARDLYRERLAAGFRRYGKTQLSHGRGFVA